MAEVSEQQVGAKRGEASERFWVSGGQLVGAVRRLALPSAPPHATSSNTENIPTVAVFHIVAERRPGFVNALFAFRRRR